MGTRTDRTPGEAAVFNPSRSSLLFSLYAFCFPPLSRQYA
jgi:hypothetical protein